MNKILCFIFGHKYRLLKIVSPTTRELKCKRCNREFGMNDDAKVVLPMDKELRDVHNWEKQ